MNFFLANRPTILFYLVQGDGKPRFFKSSVMFDRVLNTPLEVKVAFRSSHRSWSVKMVLLKISQNSQKNIFAKVSFLSLRPATLLKKENLAQLFSSEFCKILKNSFFYIITLVAVSKLSVKTTVMVFNLIFLAIFPKLIDYHRDCRQISIFLLSYF